MRYLDPNKSYPRSLQEVSPGSRALDWTLHAFDAQGITREQIVFVGGYHVEKVIKAYPGMKYYFHEAWDREKQGEALKLARKELDGPCFICDTNVVFRDRALEKLSEVTADIVIGSVTGAQNEKMQEGQVGLICLSAAGSSALQGFLDTDTAGEKDLAEIWTCMDTYGVTVQSVDISSDCAVLSDLEALSRFVLGSKAQTLERLQPVLKHATVLPQVRFSPHEWYDDRKSIMVRICENLKDDRLVVRSSAGSEDSWESSQAGRYTSVLNVDASSEKELADAVDTVIRAYCVEESSPECDSHEVFVQPCLTDVALSGVILTRDLDTAAPYYIMTIDRSSGRTDSVTGGDGQEVETFVCYKNTQQPLSAPFLEKLVDLARELEDLLEHDSLDIEFAVDENDVYYVLQVRPLLHNNKRTGLVDSDFEEELQQVRVFVDDLMQPSTYVHGRKTLLGNMPDWNPAEIIGTAPRPLALSLYQTLITDAAWAQARSLIGYRDVTGEPLLVSLAGVPYIDLRASFNSFLPASLGDDTAARLVDVYLALLSAKPNLHDKIEFEIAITCLSFDFEEQIGRLQEAGLSGEDISALRGSLLQLTDSILCGDVSPYDELVDSIKLLSQSRDKLIGQPVAVRQIPRTITYLVRDCIRYGTIPFSVLARYAFIAISILKSLSARGVFSDNEYHELMNSIPTIASQVSRDLYLLGQGEMPEETFSRTYGHLRPGTYDITSPNYARMTDVFKQSAFPAGAECSGADACTHNSEKARRILLNKQQQITALLQECGFSCAADKLIDFILHVIPGREWAKFEFTKNINAVLELVAEYCGALGFSREEASYLSIERIMRLATDSPSYTTAMRLQRLIGLESKRHSLTASLRLPHFIAGVNDLNAFQLLQWQPNFITRRCVTAGVVDLDQNPEPDYIEGSVVLIESADPGFDWIFSYRPAGLITQYGGAASHMAIRSAEFNLPAAIGCGDLLFERAKRSRRVELDCANKNLRFIL